MITFTKDQVRTFMLTALTAEDNYNEDGSVNWNFVDSDVYMFISPTGRENVDAYYEMFDTIADELSA